MKTVRIVALLALISLVFYSDYALLFGNKSGKLAFEELVDQSQNNRELAKSLPGEGRVSGQLSVGDQAPDFDLELIDGEIVPFSEHLQQSNGPTILVFSRGHW